MLLLAMIPLHMLTFSLVTMVADFCSLVILIHNTVVQELQGLTKYYTSIPQYVMIYFHMQRLKFIDAMVIEVRFFKNKKKMENMAKM